jgi:predicted glycogen debranching enzyme
MIDIDRQVLGDPEGAGRLEWLETNGLGGWAGSTLSGAHSSRHHHLLRLPAPQGESSGARERGRAAAQAGGAAMHSGIVGPAAGTTRFVALSKLDEMVIEDGRIHELGCNRFPFLPSFAGLRYLAAFQRDLFPVWEYRVGDIRLRKTLLLVDGEDTLVAYYEVLAAPGLFVLALRPFFAVRAAQALGRAELPGAVPALAQRQDGLALRWETGEEMYLAAPASGFEARGDWWYRFELEGERRRGLNYHEDLWTPGLVHRRLGAGDHFGIVISATDSAGREAGDLLAKERRRRNEMLGLLPVQDELTRVLALAGDQFVSHRPGRVVSLACGYPDGEESTADALIALPGLLLATGRADLAKRLLRGVARAVVAGALPDLLPGAHGEARRESLDASLWFAVAIQRYWQATGDDTSMREALLPALVKIVAGHERGAASGLRGDGDGLLEAAPGSPAAACRPGKAAEINALWCNALATLAAHGARLGGEEAKEWIERSRRSQRRYAETFWNAAAGCLFDSILPAPAGEPGGTGDERRDPALAAHQVLAIGLPFPALSKARGQRLLATLEERLYQPAGVRDRAGAPETTPDDRAPAVISAAAGGARRDLPWPWLLGPYLTALVWLRGAGGRRQALQYLAETADLDAQLASGIVGTLAELPATEPSLPPAGRLAHAATVGELLRVYVAELRITPAPSQPPQPSPPKRPRPGRTRLSARSSRQLQPSPPSRQLQPPRPPRERTTTAKPAAAPSRRRDRPDAEPKPPKPKP